MAGMWSASLRYDRHSAAAGVSENEGLKIEAVQSEFELVAGRYIGPWTTKTLGRSIGSAETGIPFAAVTSVALFEVSLNALLSFAAGSLGP